MAGRGPPSLATRSGRGGTTGRAAGCPAKGRFGGGPTGVGPGEAGAGPEARAGSAGLAGRGTIAGLGTGAPGAAGAVRGPGKEALSAGRGWRGPDKICPGLGAGGGAGTGLAGGAVDAGRPGAKTRAGGVWAGVPGADLAAGADGAGCAEGVAECKGGWTGRPDRGGRKREITLCSSTGDAPLWVDCSGSSAPSEVWAAGAASAGAVALGASGAEVSSWGSASVRNEPLVSGSPCAAWDAS